MNNILIVEDDKNTRKLMEIWLKSDGFNIFTAQNGREAIDVIDNNTVDLIIVDVMMPIMNGYELMKTLRESGNQTPSIMVTAKGDIEDKKTGFLIGIDDYMVKPVDHTELVLRIKALLRRAKIVYENKITIGNCTLDYNTLTVFSTQDKSKQVSLPKKEFEILFKLLSYPEKVFTKSQLINEFWAFDTESSEDVIKVHVNKIRNLIKDFPEIDIQTIRGLGYKGVKNA